MALVNIVKDASCDPVHEYNFRNNNHTKLLNPRTERFFFLDEFIGWNNCFYTIL